MKVLSFDSGAHRAGWAVLDSGPIYIDSGVDSFPRGKEKFQQYRMQLAYRWVMKTEDLLKTFEPDVVITETVPSRGAPINDQLYLANVMATTVHAIALAQGYWVEQVSARKVHSYIAVRKEGVKVTKPQVRNGVLERLPELKPRFKDWVKIYEEPDAIAIALHYLDINT